MFGRCSCLYANVFRNFPTLTFFKLKGNFKIVNVQMVECTHSWRSSCPCKSCHPQHQSRTPSCRLHFPCSGCNRSLVLLCCVVPKLTTRTTAASGLALVFWFHGDWKILCMNSHHLQYSRMSQYPQCEIQANWTNKIRNHEIIYKGTVDYLIKYQST